VSPVSAIWAPLLEDTREPVRVPNMPPTLALLLWLILLLALLYFDPAKTSRTSGALWVPVIWMFFLGSRLPSLWLGFGAGSAVQALEEGNPLDRTVDLVLILLAIAILMSRSFQWHKFFTSNLALVAFVGFGLMSVLWSDFPFIAFKRWFRDLGSYFAILVVLSDPRPLEAVRTVLRRLAYLLIPLSILLNKYFPQISKLYDQWSGAGMFVGATQSKNMLGVLCLVSGLFFFWDTVTRWKERKEKRTKRILMVNFAFIGMTLWLLYLSNSATSRVCLVIGCLVILATHSKMFQRHPGFVKTLVPSCFVLYLVLAFGFDLNGQLASQLGRDPTLTDRTLIWKTVLSEKTNPLVGTGYESFWLGPRLRSVWRAVGAMGGITEAHNGYLEVYLNLGLIGVFLLGGLLITSYRTNCKLFTSCFDLASLNLALWTITLFYNMTEAAFKSQLMWVTFLIAAVAVPQRAADRAGSVVAFGTESNTGRFPELESPRMMTRAGYQKKGR
jgi:exopolysaccharide production protein ExoQ